MPVAEPAPQEQPDAPSALPPTERRRAIAALLAAGVLRLRARAALVAPAPGPEEADESVPN
jgi:hypothetical protein